MRYNNNLYLVNKYVRLKFAILCGISFGEDRQIPKRNGFCKRKQKIMFFLLDFYKKKNKIFNAIAIALKSIFLKCRI